MIVTTETKRKLINHYVAGWIKNDLNLIISSLSPNCIIIESHGSVYKGVLQVKKWIEGWISKGSYVTQWEINSFYFLKNTAFVEWDFECIVSGKKHKLEGMSIVKFKSNKISYIREYRTTKPIVA